MMQPWKIIQELEADNSRLKKEAIIRRESDADNIRFFDGVCMALDGFRTFGVQKVPVAKKNGKGIPEAEFLDTIKKLEERKQFYIDSGTPAKFYQEYMNQAKSPEDQIFSEEDINDGIYQGNTRFDEEADSWYIQFANGDK